MRWLALESSCDETALAVWDSERRRVIFEQILSQIDIHAAYGGVVPGIAIREHLKGFPIVLDALQKVVDLSTIGAICVTHGPGLIGCLGMGVAYAQSLQLLLKCQLYGINHLHGHALSPFIEPFENDADFTLETICPHLGLLVSGGNTLLYEMNVTKNFESIANGSYDECAESEKSECEHPSKNTCLSPESAANAVENRFPSSDRREDRNTSMVEGVVQISSLPGKKLPEEGRIMGETSLRERELLRSETVSQSQHTAFSQHRISSCVFPKQPRVTFRVWAQTVDDAAGEALDKGGKLLGFPYPGGPLVERCAQGGNEKFVQFPRAFSQTSELKFSFSGLKTSLRYFLEKTPLETIEKQKASICASYQAAVTNALVNKVQQVLKMKPFKSLGVSGGVSNNQRLRQRLQQTANKAQIPLFMPKKNYCGDNAAMIAFAAPFVATPVQLNPNRTLDEKIV